MAFAFAQSKSAMATSGTPTLTLTAPATAGNLLVAAIGAGQTAVVPTITGWTPLTVASAGTGGSTRSLRLFYLKAAGGESAIAAAASMSNWVFAVVEWSGVHQTTQLDVENAIDTVSAVTHTTPTVSPVASTNRLAVFATFVRTGTTWSNQQVNGSAAGVTEREDLPVSTLGTLQLSDLDVAVTSGTYAGSADAASAAVGAAAIAMFAPASAPASAPVLNRPFQPIPFMR